MTRTVQIPDLTEQLAEIVADPTAYVRRTRELANAARPLTLVRDIKRCIVHDETYTTVCRGCRADEIAADDDEARRRGA